MIYLRNSTRKHRLNLRALKKTARALLVAAGEPDSTVSLSFVGDAAMRRLNRESRGKDRSTDVLSFPLLDAGSGHRGLGDARDFPSMENRYSATFRSRPPGSAESWRPRDRDARSPRPTGTPTRPRGGVGALVPERMLGDIVISVDMAARQAVEYDATLDEELARLLIHGVLHLLGHDHEEARERALMVREERRLARAIGLRWPYEGG